MSRRTDGFYAKRHHQRKCGREEHRRKSTEHRCTSLQRCNLGMREPVAKLRQKRKHQRERENRKQLAPEKFRRRNRRKLQKFQRIAFALARKSVTRQGCTHRSHQAAEQKHHVAFHALHNLATVTRHGNRLARRKNHRRDDERDPETRIPENQTKFVFKNMEHISRQ